MSAPLQARAEVVTEAPERYAKQLVAHLGRKVTFRTEGGRSTAVFGDGTGPTGTGSVEVADGLLVLHAQASDRVGLARVEDVLGRHLERFGQRNELTVTWVEISADEASVS